jgi:DNA-directed RNA polymerase specialized sigma24 family protein
LQQDQSEHQLIEKIRRGDRRAFAVLYDKYAPALNGVIARIVDDQKVAEEVLQLTFMNIWEAVREFDPAKGRLFTWMLQIARKASIKAASSSTYKAKKEIRAASDSVSDAVTRSRSVHPGPQGQLSAVELVYYKSHTLAMAADALGCTVPQVLQKIREELERTREKMMK